MDFELTQEQEMIRATVRDFAEKEIRPVAAYHDQTGEFPSKTVAKMGSLGLMGMLIPTEYEGAGLDTISFALALEEVARICGSHALIMSAHNTLGMGNIWLTGTEEQKKRYIPDLASGRKLAAWALTEPASGSDAAAMRTTATKTANGWVLNGAKNFCTNAPVASTFVIMAVTDPTKGNKGISAFIVERSNPGLKVGKMEDKLGVRASGTAQVLLNDCEVPRDALLGEEHRGFVNALRILDNGRIGIGAMAVGLAQGALEEAVKYAKSRKVFGAALAKQQAVQFQLAELHTDCELVRHFIFYTAWRMDRKDPLEVSDLVSMCNFRANRLVCEAADRAMQVHGGMGYTRALPFEHIYRHHRRYRITEGSEEIQIRRVAQYLFEFGRRARGA